MIDGLTPESRNFTDHRPFFRQRTELPSSLVVICGVIGTACLVNLPVVAIWAWGNSGWAVVVPVWIFAVLWFAFWASA